MLVFYPIIKGFSYLTTNFTTFLFNNYSYKINLNAMYELIPQDQRDKLFKFPLESVILNRTFEPNMSFFLTIASYLTSIGNFGVDNLLYKNKYFNRNAFRYEFECPKKGDTIFHRKNFIKGWINLGIDFIFGIGIVWLLHFSIAKGFTFEGSPNVLNSFKFGLIFIFILLFFMIFGLNTHFLPTLFKPFTASFGDKFKKNCDNSNIEVKNLTDFQVAMLFQKNELKYVNNVILKYINNPLVKKLKKFM